MVKKKHSSATDSPRSPKLTDPLEEILSNFAGLVGRSLELGKLSLQGVEDVIASKDPVELRLRDDKDSLWDLYANAALDDMRAELAKAVGGKDSERYRILTEALRTRLRDVVQERKKDLSLKTHILIGPGNQS